jgi:hypothetical protein
VREVFKIYRHERMSANLHEMHALLHQLQDLHDSHDLDHCEGYWTDKISGGVAAAGRGVVAAANGAWEAHTKHKLNVADQRKRDATVLAKWGEITDPTLRRDALKRVVDMLEPNVLGPVLLGNETTKYATQMCILPIPEK